MMTASVSGRTAEEFCQVIEEVERFINNIENIDISDESVIVIMDITIGDILNIKRKPGLTLKECIVNSISGRFGIMNNDDFFGDSDDCDHFFDSGYDEDTEELMGLLYGHDGDVHDGYTEEEE